ITLGRLTEDFSEAFLKSLLMHFMLEDFPRSLPESSILKDFWNNSWKTLGRLSKDSRETLGRLSKDSRKTHERLSEDFLEKFLMYFMLEDFVGSLQKVFQILLPKGVQIYLC
ncbi:hypothetical protein IGI04_006593, partial [Brassica rapa subsp. trilocularis]